MAKIMPFRGVRYNPAKIPDLSLVMTPPYDVIDAAAQRKYYEMNPVNFIRLELGYQFPTDNESDNRYTRAAADYRLWLAEGILIKESGPAVYLYEQEFTISSTAYQRNGLFARVGLEDYATGHIVPHEETMAKPKADRLALTEACTANFSSVFALYDDPAGQLTEVLVRVKNSIPDLDITDEVGEKHRLWVVADPAIHQQIASTMADKELFIADGHHRYETALNFYHAHGDQYPGAGSVLMYLVDSGNSGLVVLPTHRLVHSLSNFGLDAFLKELQQDFAVEPIDWPQPENIAPLLMERAHSGDIVMLMATGEPAAYILTLRHHGRVQNLEQEHSQAWCQLDVSVLQTLILHEILGMDAEKLARQENLTYIQDKAEALKAVQNGDSQLVFFLNPTKISQLTAVSGARDKMPQKSTYFYPKLLTGVIINDLRS
jgi:uncharacterized protein (DUF1015 family)